MLARFLLVRNKGPVQGFLPVSEENLKRQENEDSENHGRPDGCGNQAVLIQTGNASVAATLCIFLGLHLLSL